MSIILPGLLRGLFSSHYPLVISCSWYWYGCCSSICHINGYVKYMYAVSTLLLQLKTTCLGYLFTHQLSRNTYQHVKDCTGYAFLRCSKTDKVKTDWKRNEWVTGMHRAYTDSPIQPPRINIETTTKSGKKSQHSCWCKKITSRSYKLRKKTIALISTIYVAYTGTRYHSIWRHDIAYLGDNQVYTQASSQEQQPARIRRAVETRNLCTFTRSYTAGRADQELGRCH